MKSLLNVTLKDYKYFNKIVIELIPIEEIKDKQMFINYDENLESYYHIYFNDDNEKEITNGFFSFIFSKKNIISKSDKV